MKLLRLAVAYATHRSVGIIVDFALASAVCISFVRKFCKCSIMGKMQIILIVVLCEWIFVVHISSFSSFSRKGEAGKSE